MAKRIEKFLTDQAQPAAKELSRRASVKLVLSAGVLCLKDQSPESRELYLDLAAGFSAPQLIANQRQKTLDNISQSLLASPDVSPVEKKKIEHIFSILEAMYVQPLVEIAKQLKSTEKEPTK